jgi:hypothetical protein
MNKIMYTFPSLPMSKYPYTGSKLDWTTYRTYRIINTVMANNAKN